MNKRIKRKMIIAFYLIFINICLMLFGMYKDEIFYWRIISVLQGVVLYVAIYFRDHKGRGKCLKQSQS